MGLSSRLLPARRQNLQKCFTDLQIKGDVMNTVLGSEGVAIIATPEEIEQEMASLDAEFNVGESDGRCPPLSCAARGSGSPTMFAPGRSQVPAPGDHRPAASSARATEGPGGPGGPPRRAQGKVNPSRADAIASQNRGFNLPEFIF